METIELMPTRIRVTSIIKKAILSGEYKAGEELSLTGVAEQLGISRTPVREAFQTLAAEGLITLRMNKGAIVNAIDRKFVEDNFDMRILLESEAAARAAARGMETEELLARVRSLKGRLDSISRREYEELNQDIHMAIWRAADNKKLKNYLMELWNGPSTGHSVPETAAHYEKSTEEHILILEAIRDRKEDAARAAMRQHILRSRDNILQFYA